MKKHTKIHFEKASDQFCTSSNLPNNINQISNFEFQISSYSDSFYMSFQNINMIHEVKEPEYKENNSEQDENSLQKRLSDYFSC
jgi:hypothetical protein